jgi:hypothetical protein
VTFALFKPLALVGLVTPLLKLLWRSQMLEEQGALQYAGNSDDYGSLNWPVRQDQTTLILL